MGLGAAGGQSDIPQRRRLFLSCSGRVVLPRQPYCAAGGVGGSSPRVLTAGRVYILGWEVLVDALPSLVVASRNRQAVIVEGPSKVYRVPFLIGPSNSGKTTLVQPLESLFGSTRH